MAANLVIVVSNTQPKREENYAQAWLLYQNGQDPLELRVVHDSNRRPHVQSAA